MKVIDLTHTIKEEMPVYPGTAAPVFTPANNYKKDGFKETCLQMYTHTGTHVDPPAHLFEDKMTLEQFPADWFIGKAIVIDCRDLCEGEDITMEHVKKIKKQKKQIFFFLISGGINAGEQTLILMIIPVLMKKFWIISSEEIIKVLALM